MDNGAPQRSTSIAARNPLHLRSLSLLQQKVGHILHISTHFLCSLVHLFETDPRRAENFVSSGNTNDSSVEFVIPRILFSVQLSIQKLSIVVGKVAIGWILGWIVNMNAMSLVAKPKVLQCSKKLIHNGDKLQHFITIDLSDACL